MSFRTATSLDKQVSELGSLLEMPPGAFIRVPEKTCVNQPGHQESFPSGFQITKKESQTAPPRPSVLHCKLTACLPFDVLGFDKLIVSSGSAASSSLLLGDFP